jgi:alpha-D-ribose 1-methylphosphonate 5-triphosphate synthase subunit PhnH
MTYQAEALTGGFDNPVFGAQAIFRAVMNAMARPGTIEPCNMDPQAPEPFSTAQGAIALTLCDHDTPVWLSPRLATASVKGWMAFHTGADMAQSMASAQFAFFDQGDAIPDFCGFAAGSQDYPDRSATLILALPALSGGPELVARGPGINGERTISPQGLPGDFEKRWASNHNLFPRGIDLILCSGTDIMCLPRSVRLQMKEA